MKKRIISFLLVCVTLLSSLVLSSCGGETPIEDVEAKVYNLYTICGEGTTNKAIREVELALNRLTFYQLGICVRLEMFSEDEYQQAITDKLAEVKAYTDEKNKKGKDKDKKNESAEESSVNSADVSEVDVFTGDDYIDQLSRNLEIIEEVEVRVKKGEGTYDELLATYNDYNEFEFEAPRLDIFLVLGYDNYIDLVGKGLLSALDEKLSNEAKIIRDYIYPTFLDAAKVTNAKGTRKTYGVPMNKGIGEYDYIVFDKEYLDKYKIDAGTMTNLEDLEYYLRILSENETDVIPLVNVFDSPEFAYLFEDGFSAYIKDGVYVTDTYSDDAALDYYTMISRYRTMGYLKDCGNNDRWAVRFIRGTYEDLEQLEADTGRQYDYTIHSYPIATNEDLLESLFCISAYTISNELTDVSKLLAYIESQPEAANLLTYGVAGTHYDLDDNGQVIRLSKDYMVDSKYTGNSFLTYTMAGENPNKWKLLQTQNIDSSKTADQSVSVGFAYYPVSIEHPNDSSILFDEPNYVNIIKDYCNEFYPEILTGKLANITYQELVDTITPSIKEDLLKAVEEKYKKSVEDLITVEIAEKWGEESDWYKDISAKGYELAVNKYSTTTYKKKIKDDVRKEVAEDPKYNATTETINARVEELCTPEYLTERIELKYASEIQAYCQNSVEKTFNKKVKDETESYKNSEEYTARIQQVLNSEECQAELNAIKDADIFKQFPDECLDKAKALLKEKLQERLDQYFEGLDAVLQKAYNDFLAEYLNTFSATKENPVIAEKAYATAIFYVVNSTKLGNKSLKNALNSELRNIIEKEMNKPWYDWKEKHDAWEAAGKPADSNPGKEPEKELTQNIADKLEVSFNEEWISGAVLEVFNYNKASDKDAFVFTTANKAIADIINDYMKQGAFTMDAINEMYNSVLLLNFENNFKLVHTVMEVKDDKGAVIGISAYVPDESEEGGKATAAEEPSTFYDLIFEQRIEVQYYKYKPLPENG